MELVTVPVRYASCRSSLVCCSGFCSFRAAWSFDISRRDLRRVLFASFSFFPLVIFIEEPTEGSKTDLICDVIETGEMYDQLSPVFRSPDVLRDADENISV